jgi:hypothetical protein
MTSRTFGSVCRFPGLTGGPPSRSQLPHAPPGACCQQGYSHPVADASLRHVEMCHRAMARITTERSVEHASEARMYLTRCGQRVGAAGMILLPS